MQYNDVHTIIVRKMKKSMYHKCIGRSIPNYTIVMYIAPNVILSGEMLKLVNPVCRGRF